MAEKTEDELLHLIRNRFRQSKHVHSIRRLKLSFEAGYEAIDWLDNAAAGDQESKNYILHLLSKAPEKARQAPLKRASNSVESKKPSLETADGEPRPKASIFDRPLPLEQLSGRRHVPVLFSANRIPVLRIKKPQPESLSKYIYQRIQLRQRHLNQRDAMVQLQYVSRCEDEWEQLMAQRLEEEGLGKGWSPPLEPRWETAAYEGFHGIDGRLYAMKEKSRIMAERMQDIVDQERELYEQERKDRLEAKERRRVERRGQVEGGNHVPVATMSHDQAAK